MCSPTLRLDEECAIHAVGSGSYRFTARERAG